RPQSGLIDDAVYNSINPDCREKNAYPATNRSPLGERAHDLVKRGLRFEADTRNVGQAHEAVFNRAIVGEAAERGEHVGVGFIAAEAEPDRDVEGELVPAMRHAAPRRP